MMMVNFHKKNMIEQEKGYKLKACIMDKCYMKKLLEYSKEENIDGRLELIKNNLLYEFMGEFLNSKLTEKLEISQYTSTELEILKTIIIINRWL